MYIYKLPICAESMFLNIHLEGCDDNGERLESLAESNKPFGISLVPVLLAPNHEVFTSGVYRADYYYPERVVEILKQCAKMPNIVFGQQGLTHYCLPCFEQKDKKDPWHENSCLYQTGRAAGKQGKFMKEGRTLIEDKIGVSPVIYVAPNHQFDEFSLDATRELGYRYFAERAVLEIKSYSDDGQRILPERKVNESGQIFYIHYDEIKINSAKCDAILKDSLPIEKIDFGESFSLDRWANRVLVKFRKKMRDVKKKRLYI